MGPAFSIMLLCLAGILVYSNTFTNSFHLDDATIIVENNTIRELDNFDALWHKAPTRVFSCWTFALNYHFGGLDVVGYHLVNIVIHILSGIALWWLIQLLFKTRVLRGTSAYRYKKILSLAGALLFIVHPVQTQAVTYIVQRIASLATLLYLVSLACYIRARLEQQKKNIRNAFFLASIFSAFLAVFSKETSYTLPLAVVLFEIFFMDEKSRIRKLIIYFGVGTTIAVPLLFYFLGKIEVTQTHNITRIEYLLTQFTVIPVYMRLLVLPINQNLDYDVEVVKSFSNLWAWSGLTVILAVLAAGFFLYRRYRLLSFGIFWFFLTLTIESSIYPITDVMFEHRLYLPMAGFCFIFVALFEEASKIFSRPVIKFAAGIIILVFAVSAYARNEVWKDEISLWNDCVEKSPAKIRPHMNRGTAYQKKGMLDKAMQDYETVLRLAPDNWTALSNVGSIYEMKGDYDKAIDMYTRSIEVNKGKTVETFYSRANNYIKKGFYVEAIHDLDVYLRKKRDNAGGFYSRGGLKRLLHDSEGAIADFTKAIELDSSQGIYFFERGALYDQAGRVDEAMSDYEKAIQRNSHSFDSHINRGFILARRGKFKEAIEEYTLALQEKPNSVHVLCDRGLTKYKNREYQEALDDLNKAIEYDSLSPLLYKNRSIIYKALGQQQKAEWDARKAERLLATGSKKK